MDSLDLTFVRCPSCRSLVPAISTRCRMCGASLETSPANDVGAVAGGSSSSSGSAHGALGSTASDTPSSGGSVALKRFDDAGDTSMIERSGSADASRESALGESAEEAHGSQQSDISDDPLGAYVEEFDDAGAGQLSSSEQSTGLRADSDENQSRVGGAAEKTSLAEGTHTGRNTEGDDVDPLSEFAGEPIEARAGDVLPQELSEADPLIGSESQAGEGSHAAGRRHTLSSASAEQLAQDSAQSDSSSGSRVGSQRSDSPRVGDSPRGSQVGGFEARRNPNERRFRSPESAPRMGAGASRAGSGGGTAGGREGQSLEQSRAGSETLRGEAVAQSGNAGGSSGNIGGGNAARRIEGRGSVGPTTAGGNAAVARNPQVYATQSGNAAVAAQQGARATRETPVFGTGKLVGWMVSYADTRGSSVELREGKFFVTAKSIKEHDLVLEDRSVSTPHALVSCGRDGGLLIQDLMSDRGVFVRRRGSTQYRQEEEAIPVEHGDWVRFGDLEFLIVLIPAGAE